MAITYPLTLPAAFKTTEVEFTPRTVVGIHRDVFTGQSQTFVWPGQWWEFSMTVPPRVGADADACEAFLLSLNGVQGSFYFGDPARPTTLGTVAGTVQVGAGAVGNSTTLPLQGGTGTFAVGDWIQVGTRLHRIVKVNGSTSVDIFPRLRSNYAQGTNVIYTNPVGIFQLASNDVMKWSRNMLRHGLVTLSGIEKT